MRQSLTKDAMQPSNLAEGPYMANSKTPHPEPTRQAETGVGGELHQLPAGDGLTLTTNQGVVSADNQNSLKANAQTHGPVRSCRDDRQTEARGRRRRSGGFAL